jgi:molecular chaperone GrpE
VSEKEGKVIPINRGSNTIKADKEKGSEIQEHAPSQPMKVSQANESEKLNDEPKTPPDPLAQAKKEAEDNRDRWMRAVADLENYKKRSLQEKTRLLKYRNEELLRDLLPVADNIGRAVSHCSATGRSDAVSDGLCMILGMFRDALSKHGVTEVEALGKPFDPRFHEAIAQTPAPGKAPNTVIEELEKGYLYHDRLLRPAKVVVSAPEAQ